MTDAPQNLADELKNAPEVAHADDEANAAGREGEAESQAPDGGQGSDRGRRDRPDGAIWEGCPVTPLGVYGDISFYLDVRGQLRGVDNHSQQKMLHLFGGRRFLLAQHFPTFDKDSNPRPGMFNALHLSAAMIQACEECGVWSPARSMRGPGCWADDDGRLIYHAGDEVLIDGEWQPPGRYHGKTYSAFEPIPRPAPRDAKTNPGSELLPILQSWTWRRDDLDPFLLLGVVASMMCGGALTWRPVSWLTGDAAHGKSTLQELIKYLMGGDTGLIQSADATKAGILSQVGHSSLPVAIDELEPSEDGSQREKDIITAARIAASGGQFIRGSADHKGHSGNVYSVFFFSSILIPHMKPQDLSRLITLDLDTIPAGTAKLTLDPRKLRRIGEAMRRRIVDGWDTWADRLETWRLALGRAEISGRQADNYGTILALADMVMHDELPTEDVLANWADKLQGALATDPEEAPSNHSEMLDYLLTQPIDVWRRGRKYTVAQFLAWAANLPGAENPTDVDDYRQANKVLAGYGLRVIGTGDTALLSIANKKFGNLCDLFEGSLWAEGVWKQAAERVPGAARGVNRTFARTSSRCTDIPFTALPGMLHFPADKSTVRADQARSTSPSPDIDTIG
ncbi:MAG: hypothetical protein AAFX07_00615 [Pseudomonadota bacterium]